MIGWENNQGAYFVNKLSKEIDDAVSDISDISGNVTDLTNNIGDLTDLTTETKTDIVSAVNEIDSGKQDTLDNTDTTIGSPYEHATVLSNKVRKYGKIVVINFALYLTSSASATGETTIGVLPANYRPIEGVYAPAGYSGSPTACYCNIGTGGNIVVPAALINAKGVITVNAVYVVE